MCQANKYSDKKRQFYFLFKFIQFFVFLYIIAMFCKKRPPKEWFVGKGEEEQTLAIYNRCDFLPVRRYRNLSRDAIRQQMQLLNNKRENL